MPSRRFAETFGVGCVLGAAVIACTTLALGHRSAEPPLAEVYAPDPIAPVACDAPRDPFPSEVAPADVGRPGADAMVTGSGVHYRPLALGCGGASPVGDDVVQVRLAGWTIDGTEIVKTPELLTMRLTAVVPGFREGLELMHVGDRFRLWVPGQLAYDRNAGTTGPGPHGMLTFDVELIGVSGPR